MQKMLFHPARILICTSEVYGDFSFHFREKVLPSIGDKLGYHSFLCDP